MGAWGWAARDDRAQSERDALASCQKHSREVCEVYAVNDKVVWTP